MPNKPLAIDLFCGLGGWTEGLLSEGYRVIGFDIERHCYGEASYPTQLVIQDVLTLHGAQFKGAALIVASPPCQAYSYRAMPWKRAKALPPPDNTLFESCFRIQREACEAAGRYIPLVVENVCGAQKWVGKARWHYGSFYLWGDVPALMPIVKRPLLKSGHCNWDQFGTAGYKGHQMQDRAIKVHGLNWSNHGKSDYKAEAFNGEANKRLRATKNTGGSWFSVAHNTTSGKGQNPDGRRTPRNNPRDAGVKQHGSGAIWFDSGLCRKGSRTSARRAASAHIAKIPLPLARHVAAAWKPLDCDLP